MSRTRFDAAMDKRIHMEDCESNGMVADSMEVRMALMKKVEGGEITLQQAQEELQKIKRNAKKNGLMTRTQAWREG
ncbi:hypothetical protein F6Q07_21605 [Pectobacterium parmentieri]|uniref:hypothetical protein n=1 Tax=Pectobacterium TaxID=122277 RepID=UPI000EB11226|nr:MULTISPECIES: hypothetical protein [Pectobacterium]AYH33271.1 hypothetical protein C5E19_17485 [Pectobacterium parmentieri]MBI0520690.1 hypothetical protein [Pectobacterium parmentieri]